MSVFDERQTGNNGREGDTFPDFQDIAAMWHASCITTALHIILKTAEHPAVKIIQQVRCYYYCGK